MLPVREDWVEVAMKALKPSLHVLTARSIARNRQDVIVCLRPSKHAIIFLNGFITVFCDDYAARRHECIE